MGSFSIEIEVANVRLLSGDDAPLWGPVWLCSGDTAFPEPGWWDFMGSMFGSLVTALDGLSRGRPRCDAYFFDGSFTVRMARKNLRWHDRFRRPGGSALVSYDFIKELDEEAVEVRFASEAPLGDLIDEVHRSATDALAAMNAIEALAGPSLRNFQKNIEILGRARARLGRRRSKIEPTGDSR